MRTTLFAAGAVAALLLLAAAPVLADESAPAMQEITGQVVDAAGHPAAGVAVAMHWMEEAGRWVARQGVETDAEGRFTLSVRRASRVRSVMALDATQERGAVAALDEATLAAPLVLRLRATSRVEGAFASPALGHDLERTYVSFTAVPGQIAVATWIGSTRFALPLPAGEYRLGVGATDCQRVAKRIVLTTDMRRVDLGTTDMEPTIIARHYGKAPPAWHVTDARGLEKEVTLADFKGRWVLLEFWGHW